VPCAPANDCRSAGTCDGSGHCQYTALADGLSCGDDYHYCLSGSCTNNWTYCDYWIDITDVAQCVVGAPGSAVSDYTGACSCANSSTMQIPPGTDHCDICLSASGVTPTNGGTRFICRNAL
jgi:hypothetical protein